MALPTRSANRWRWINPLWWIRSSAGILLSPVLLKELQIASRRKRTYILRALYLLLLILGMLQAWWVSSDVFAQAATAEAIQSRGQVGEVLSITFGWMQLIIIALVAPMLTGSCISDEIENRTIDSLLTTPLTVAQIVVGKLTSRLATIVTMILLPAPLLLALRTFGGFEVDILVRIEVVALCTALLGAAVGLLMSCWEGLGWRAVALAYFWLGMFWFIMPVGVGAFVELIVYLGAKYFHIDIRAAVPYADIELITPALMMLVNPFAIMYQITWSAVAPMPFTIVPASSLAWMFAAVSTTLSILTVLLTIPILRRVARLHSAGASGHWWVRWRAERAARAQAVEQSASHETRSRPQNKSSTRPNRSVWNNAILWREMRWAVVRRPFRLGITIVALAGGIIWYNVKLDVLSDPELNIPFVILGIAAQLILAIIVAPTTITGEKKLRSWDVLLCVPVTSRRILWAKYFGTMKIASLPAAVVVGQLWYVALFNHITYDAHMGAVLIGYLAVGLGFSSLFTAIGIAVSLLLKRALSAMAMNFAVIFTLWGLVPIMFAMTAQFSRGYNEGFENAMLIGATAHPFYWIGILVEATADWPPSWRMDGTYEDTSATQFVLVMLTLGATLALLTAAIIEVCHLVFPRITGRTS